MDATVLAIVRMGFTVLTDRLLTLCSLWMTFGIACWAMYQPSAERLQVAVGFAIIVFVPSLLKERRREGRQQHQESE